MGLLDFSGFVGDDTAKDEYGMTQADRRAPLFSGLLKAGMLGMAAGENITPGARAQLLGQIGGAIGDIPSAMMHQRTQGAQQILQQQQIKAGQAKLGTAEKLAALAKSPEFQAAVARLEPEERMLLQAALDAGDMAHAQQILSGAQKARTATAETARREARDDAKEAAKAAADKAKEEGFGNTPYGINARNLRDAPTDSYAYYMAHQFFSTEQRLPDGSIAPKLPNMAPATWKPGMPPGGTPGMTVGSPSVPGVPSAPAAPAVPGAPAPAPAPGTPAPVPTATPTPAPAPVVIAPNAPVDAAVAAQVGAQLDPGQTREVNGVEITKDRGGNITWNDGTDYYKLPKGSTAPERKPLVSPPEHQQKALETFNTSLSAVDRLVNELDTKKVQLGPANTVITSLPFGNAALDASNPEGTDARLLIAGLTSEKIKATSGGTVTDAEFARLDKYLPKEGDSEVVLRKKLAELRLQLQAIGQNRLTTLPPETRLPPEWRQRFGAKPGAPAGGGGGPTQKEIADEMERRRREKEGGQ